MHSICNLKYTLSKKILTVFHNGSKYDYHFVIEDLPKKLKKEFYFLKENTEKYITFTVPIEEMTKNISYIYNS